jgi:UPF0755 protein
MRHIVRTLFFLVLLGLTASVGAGILFYKQWHGRGPLTVDARVLIDSGTDTITISRKLEEAGVVEDWRLFVAGVHLFANGRKLRAGEYRFGAGMSEEQVMRMLLSGATVARRITVPEGFTTAQVLKIVSSAEGLIGDLPPEPPGEGRLMPDTYFYTWGEKRFTMVNRMAEAMDRALQKLWDQRAANLPFDSMEKALVLASIVEKETSLPTERAHIAGVFVNRLRHRMPLQSDPTVIYAVTDGKGPLGRTISSADLQLKSPYNTYLVKTLPPGPICNPGLASIQAVLHPLATKDLYFVADGSGGHAFASTLAEHNRNVSAWRKYQTDVANDQANEAAAAAVAADPTGLLVKPGGNAAQPGTVATPPTTLLPAGSLPNQPTRPATAEVPAGSGPIAPAVPAPVAPAAPATQ